MRRLEKRLKGIERRLIGHFIVILDFVLSGINYTLILYIHIFNIHNIYYVYKNIKIRFRCICVHVYVRIYIYRYMYTRQIYFLAHSYQRNRDIYVFV